MARPGGNPDITKYSFKAVHNWPEPCTERLALKMPASMKAELKSGKLKNWQEVARRAIARELGWELPAE